MPKKKGKDKAPSFADPRECQQIFGVRNGDIITSPLGVNIKIKGMSKDMRLYATFPGDLTSPIEARDGEDLRARGYGLQIKVADQSEAPHDFFRYANARLSCRELTWLSIVVRIVLIEQAQLEENSKKHGGLLMAQTCRFEDNSPSSTEMVCLACRAFVHRCRRFIGLLKADSLRFCRSRLFLRRS